MLQFQINTKNRSAMAETNDLFRNFDPVMMRVESLGDHQSYYNPV